MQRYTMQYSWNYIYSSMQYNAIQIIDIRICNVMLENYLLNSCTKIEDNNINLEIVFVASITVGITSTNSRLR